MGQVLLVRLAYRDVWSLPGGGVGFGESVDRAMRREVREETGLEVDARRLAAVYSLPHRNAISLLFECQPASGALTARAGETAECAYFAFDALPCNLLPGHRERIADVIERRPEVVMRNKREE